MNIATRYLQATGERNVISVGNLLDESKYLPDNLKAHTKAMMFIDGENLSIRYKELLKSSECFTVLDHVNYKENIYV